MDKPLCRVCNAKHWSNEAHRFEVDSDVDDDETKPDEGGGEARSVGAQERGKGPLSQAERNRRWREKNRERYNAYMRNYRSKR